MRSSMFVLLWSSWLIGCSDDPSAAGGRCEPDDRSSCAAGLVCVTEGGKSICQVPLGETCDPSAANAYCVAGTECVEYTETVDGQQKTTGGCYFPEGTTCDPSAEVQCGPTRTCAQHADDSYACRLPLVFRGGVYASSPRAAIEGAHIMGLDEQRIAVTDVAKSGADGSYDLWIPIRRELDGAPIAQSFTLRASASGYETFPGGIRTALPISTTLATKTAEGWIVTGTLTELILVAIESTSGARIAITGKVVAPGKQAGVLIVANGASDGYSAITDASGAYTIFNVPAGDFEVRGYASGLQLTPVNVTAAGADLANVDLVESSSPLNTITGTMQIVDPGSCVATSVVLAVESTFDDLLGRGELPRGLRSPEVGQPPSIMAADEWTLAGIPDGRYVVLAGFENDNCVRDPDTSQAGTAIVRIELPRDAGILTQTFKVTGAMDLFGPGRDQPEAATTAPMLRWEDDAGETSYHVEVFDAYGQRVWEHTMGAVSGSATVQVQYGGPMQSGMYYQFRATSRNQLAAPLSRTEDLRGVFYVP
jgi:hypothetical protein